VVISNNRVICAFDCNYTISEVLFAFTLGAPIPWFMEIDLIDNQVVKLS